MTNMSRYFLKTLFIKSMNTSGALFKKKHYQKFIMSIPSLKYHLQNVILLHPQLVITQSEFNLVELTRSLELNTNIIYSWNMILILNSNLIQLSIINTHFERFILLSNKQHWSTP